MRTIALLIVGLLELDIIHPRLRCSIELSQIPGFLPIDKMGYALVPTRCDA